MADRDLRYRCKTFPLGVMIIVHARTCFLILLLLNTQTMFGQSKLLVPPDFTVPDSLVTKEFKLKPLTVEHTALDYDAIMKSLDHLKGVFGPKSDWPRPTMTLEEDRGDLEWHENEFRNRTS